MIAREKLNRYIGLGVSLVLVIGFIDISDRDYHYPEVTYEVAKFEKTLVSHWVADTSQVRMELETLAKLQKCEIERELHGENYRNCALEANWPSRAYKDALPKIRVSVPQIIQGFKNQTSKQVEPTVAAPSFNPMPIREDVSEYLTYLYHVVIPRLQMKIYVANGTLLLLVLLVLYKREYVGRSASNLALWLFGLVKRTGRQIHEKV